MELIFNPCGGIVYRSSEGSVSQIHSPHLHVGAHGIFLDIVRSVQMLKVGCGKPWEATAPNQSFGKTAVLVPAFAVEDLPSAELQPRFLRLF